MTSDSEKSLKARIREIAKDTSKDPADLWQNLILERFLARLEKSEYKDHFILKGGTLLSKYIELGRETKDLDFLARGIKNTTKSIGQIFSQISKVQIEDGFEFRDLTVKELVHPHMKYFGATLKGFVFYGKIRFKISVDVGFGDLVNPISYSIPLLRDKKGSVFEESVNLPCYPKEYIFAEKLETAVQKGSLNSRMKDYHDLKLIINDYDKITNSINLKEVINSVFNNRGTPLNIPLRFGKNELEQLNKFWNEYLRGLKFDNHLPEKFENVIEEINGWLETNIVYEKRVDPKQLLFHLKGKNPTDPVQQAWANEILSKVQYRLRAIHEIKTSEKITDINDRILEESVHICLERPSIERRIQDEFQLETKKIHALAFALMLFKAEHGREPHPHEITSIQGKVCNAKWWNDLDRSANKIEDTNTRTSFVERFACMHLNKENLDSKELEKTMQLALAKYNKSKPLEISLEI